MHQGLSARDKNRSGRAPAVGRWSHLRDSAGQGKASKAIFGFSHRPKLPARFRHGGCFLASSSK